MICLVLFVAFVTFLSAVNADAIDCTPRQVHIGLGEWYTKRAADFAKDLTSTNIQLRIIYLTKELCSTNILHLSNETVNFELAPTSVIHFHEESIARQIYYDGYVYVHELSGLEVSKRHFYSFSFPSEGNTSDSLNQTETWSFVLPKADTSESQTFVFFSDYDQSEVSQSARDMLHSFLTDKKDDIAAVLMGGDYAYNMEDNNGRNGDEFMEVMSPIFSRWPTMPVAGNHERFLDYAFFNNRFQLPLFNSTQNNIYSFDLGAVHFIGLNTDRLLVRPDTKEEFMGLLAADLRFADSDENRAVRPWIVAYTHRPFYTSTELALEDVQMYYKVWADIEDLFYKHNVDLFLVAHVHYYERSLPVYQNKSYPFKGDNSNLRNAEAPVYVIEGILGSKHFIDDLQHMTHPSYLAAYDNTTGFGELEVINRTTIRYAHHVSNGSVVDFFHLSKDTLRPFQSSGSNHYFAILVMSIVGGILALGALSFAVYYFFWRKKDHRQALPNEKDPEAAGEGETSGII